MAYVGGMDERGQPIDVRDPLAPRLRALSDAAPDPAARVAALLGVTEIFPPALAACGDFRDGITAAYAALVQGGARIAVGGIAG
jgi:fructuronate reductase